MKDYNNANIPLAKDLRKNMTPWERKLWYDFLRTYPIRFQRQKAIGNYIVDFYCAKARLAIELDGALHYTDSGYHHDSVRENFLSDLGIEVLRFENKTVWNGQETIIESVTRKIEERLKNSPSKLEGVPFRGRECVNKN